MRTRGHAILHGAQRGAALTQRMLSFARRQELKPEPIDLAAPSDPTKESESRRMQKDLIRTPHKPLAHFVPRLLGGAPSNEINLDGKHDAMLRLYHDRFSIQIETTDAETLLANWD